MKKILVIGRSSASTQMLIHCLNEQKYKVSWFEERRDDKKLLLVKRFRKQGFFRVFGQLIFFVFQRYLNIISYKRKKEILADFGLSTHIEPSYVTSNVNSLDALKETSNLNPDVIILSGTRILSSDFLVATKAPILNIHAGITPKYRGVHGGYWAIVNNDMTNCGATIHRVDEGVDTGEVLKYSEFDIKEADNFVTYPLLQQKSALLLLPSVISDLLSKKSTVTKREISSKIWTHPTIIEYFYYRLTRGVK